MSKNHRLTISILGMLILKWTPVPKILVLECIYLKGNALSGSQKIARSVSSRVDKCVEVSPMHRVFKYSIIAQATYSDNIRLGNRPPDISYYMYDFFAYIDIKILKQITV